MVCLNCIVTDQVNSYGNGIEKEQGVSQHVLDFCQVERSKKEICEYMGYRNRTFFTRKYLFPLILEGKLQMTQHNAVLDAEDELRIIQLLGHEINEYEFAHV